MWKPQGLYASYLLNQPILYFGEDSENGLAAMPGAKISVIHGSSLPEKMKKTLKTIFKKRVLYFNERCWKGEPDLESLSETICMLEKQQPDVIIAIGGGAVIDGAKLCRLYYEFPSFQVGETHINQLSFATRFVAIPTTIGSGAEASSAAVYVNNVEHKKEMVVCHDLQPEVVVFDASLVKDAPLRLTISSGLDAMAHIIEGYVSNMDNAMANIQAEIGLRILLDELVKMDKSQMNFERLQYAGYLGGIVQNHCIVGAAHGIAHQLTADGFSHGEAVSLLLPSVIEENSKDMVAREKYEILFHNVGIESIERFVKELQEIISKSGISSRRELLKRILESKMRDEIFVSKVASDQGAKGNPVVINQKYIENLVGGL